MKRLLYKQLVDWKSKQNRKPLLLKGARQVGKTWLIEEFGKNEFRAVHTFNFQEEPELAGILKKSLNPVNIIRSLELSYSININIEADLIFFDEIQECPEAITSLKFFFEKIPKTAVCCAGSHIGVTRLETSFPVGKIDTLILHPMNFQEFLMNNHREMLELFDKPESLPSIIHNKLLELLKVYFALGGMPEVNKIYNAERQLNLEIFKEIRYIQNQIITGYQSDFSKHAGKVNANHINRVFENIPVQIMKNTDFSVGRFRFKDVIPGYSKYSQLIGPIEWLVKAGLCHPVYVIEHPAIPLKAYRKENLFKLMLLDIGLLNSMNNISLGSILQQDFGIYKGYLAENFTAQELISYGINDLYSWRGRTSEIEFLLQDEDSVIPLEVKSGMRTSRTKSLDVFIEKHSPHTSYIASMRSYSESHKKTNMPLYWIHFLTPGL